MDIVQPLQSTHKTDSRLNQLISDVVERQLRPEDQYEIVAILESMGWNDERAMKEYGVKDLFELSETIWQSMNRQVNLTTFSNEQISTKVILIEMIRSFLRGLIFAFPMGVSVAAMLTLRYSLWSYVNFSLDQATSIAIGTILSFITVGGFTQAIARRGFFYILQGYYNLARKNTFHFIRIGFVICIVLSVLIYLVNLLFNFFPYGMIFYSIVYFFFLNAIWLSVTVMYILRKEIAFTGLLIFGIFIVFLLFSVLHMNMVVSQLIALLVISILSIFIVLFFFKYEEKKSDKGMVLKLPKLSITVYSVAPYFFYGFLYFSFLFIDRVNAWSTNQDFMPYIIWFRGPYELGLDFALLTLIIPMGFSEVIVTKLMNDIESIQKKVHANDIKKHYQRFVSNYYRMYFLIVVSAILSAFLVYRLTIWYNQVSIHLRGTDLFDNHITHFVLIIGSISYIILSICLMNAVILFAISQPNLVIQAILPSLGVNLIVGFLLSRWISYEYAVIGLLVGSVVMMILTTRNVKKVLNRLDYYLYAAT